MLLMILIVLGTIFYIVQFHLKLHPAFKISIEALIVCGAIYLLFRAFGLVSGGPIVLFPN